MDNEKMDLLRQRVTEKLKSKGINEETIKYACKYVELNEKLFGNVLDISEVAERLTDNLDHDIRFVYFEHGILNEAERMVSTKGTWDAYRHHVMIAPALEAMSKVSKTMREYKESAIYHELDHCATTTYKDIPVEEKDAYIEEYIKENGITEEEKKQEVADKINKMYEFTNGQKAIVGVKNSEKTSDEELSFTKLNEGITEYKQKMYDKELGIKSDSAYPTERKLAGIIADTIGVDEMIKLQFNNDYEGIRERFNQYSKTDLNQIVYEMNNIKRTDTVMDIFFQMQFQKKLDRYASEIDKTKVQPTEEKSHGRNTDFVPKVEIDHEQVKENMKNNELQRNIQMQQLDGMEK